MSLNLRDLEYFYQLSKLRSFTNVAKHFRVSQPTISYAIKLLETYYDCDLFYKDSLISCHTVERYRAWIHLLLRYGV